MSRDWTPGEDDFANALHRRTEELYTIPDAIPDETGLIECPVLPLRGMVVFPRMVSPIFIGREGTMLAVEAARSRHQTVIALTQQDSKIEDPSPEDFFPIGVELAVGRLLHMPDGSSSALVQGRKRIEIVEFVQVEPFMVVRARPIVEPVSRSRETSALMRTALGLLEKCVELNPSLPEEAHMYALNIDEPGWLADMIATTIATSIEEQLEILEDTDPIARLGRVSNILAREADVLELEDEIHMRVQSEVNRSQREVYLREQMRAIQTELGEGDIWNQEIGEIREKIESLGLPEEVKARALKEVTRIGQLPPMSPEVGVIRTYVEWIIDLPWSAATEDNLDIQHAADTLDQNHFALKRAKERILEHIAIKSLRPARSRQPILCFVGPPGTGKTSLGQSIAEALGRKFVRISLGGVRDEAEIRGHRRTYIGALPGRILQTMRRAGTTNPVFMLDEVDKLSHDYRGDPSSALLEVLDPEQNAEFSDHYLELPYDLSNVMFITTANWAGRIPEPLLDRMEVIDFAGYIEEEKFEIARRFLIPRQLEETGLVNDDIQLNEAALRKIIQEYTYEAGVRNLEREIGRVFRKLARRKAEGKRYATRIAPEAIEKLLGPPEFSPSEAEKTDEVGVATALAWTENGGEIMAVEVLLLDGKGSLQITGQIGDVMQESCQAAYSYLKSRARQLEIKPNIFESTDIHLHIPEGGIPKDGPSAGITIATSMISAFTGRKTRKEIGMTGEITLRGRVLPVGGIREKVLAAHRSGLKMVVLPRKNVKDLVDMPRKVMADLKIIPVEHMDQVLHLALHAAQPKPEKKKPAAAQSAPPPAP
jgi:ATP-dependent Lon protease